METENPLVGAELTYLLGMAFQLMHGEFVTRLWALGNNDLRPMHAMLFQALASDGATSTELAEHLGVTKQATGQMVSYLEERGYVERQPHPDGGTRRLVLMTDKARKHLMSSGRVLHSVEAELEQRVGAAALTQLREGLARVINELADGKPLPPLRPVL